MPTHTHTPFESTEIKAVFVYANQQLAFARRLEGFAQHATKSGSIPIPHIGINSDCPTFNTVKRQYLRKQEKKPILNRFNLAHCIDVATTANVYTFFSNNNN